MRIKTRNGEPWISVPNPGKQPEPEHLQALKDEVVRRWGTLDLLDVLKDADFLAEFTAEFTSVATQERIDRHTLRRRLLLCLFALGRHARSRVKCGDTAQARLKADDKAAVVDVCG